MEYKVISFALLSLREPLHFTTISFSFFWSRSREKMTRLVCFEVSLSLSTFAWMWELLHPQSEGVGGGGAVAFWMSMLKCLAPRDADACSDLQGTSLWEEKLVRLFAAASTNTHYTHLCRALQMAQMHKRYWVINKQNNTHKKLTNVILRVYICSAPREIFAPQTGTYKKMDGRAILSSLTLIKIFCIYVYVGQFFSLMGLSWWASPRGHSSPVPLLKWIPV